MEQKLVSSYLTPVATLISIVSAIVYITFYIGTMDKRITVVENKQSDVSLRIDALKQDVLTVNEHQNEEQQQFHDDVGVKLSEMSQRIEKIYSVLLENRKNHVV